jgi:hypothetical protein
MRTVLQEMKKHFTVINESLRGTIDEPNFIEVAIRDAREALSIYADVSRNFREITIYGSNVYASFNASEISELLDMFDQHSIEISEVVTEEEDLDEQNVTGAVAGYSTPNAFRKKTKKVDYATGLEESKKPVTKKSTPGHYQVLNFDEEIQTEKFPFSLEESDWWNGEVKYPSTNLSHTPGTVHKKDHHDKPLAEDIIEQKYEQLVEGYRDFKSDDIKPSHKVKKTIKEIAKKLQEIETLVNYNNRLKTESGVTSSAYGSSTVKALSKISERLIKISERVRALGE